jgi:hypothetical protein
VWHRCVPGLGLGQVLAGCGFRSPASAGGDPGDAAGDGSGTTADCWAHWMNGSVAIDTSTVQEIAELSSTGQDLAPWISKDGLRIYFSRDGVPLGHGDIYLASRATPTGTFAAATPVVNLNSPNEEGRAWLTSDELAIALATAHDGSLDIHIDTRAAGAPFATPVNTHLAMVNATGSLRLDPFLTEDLRRLYFSANTGPAGKLQLWIATRTAAGDDFGAPALVPGINDNSINELGPALYQDEQLLLFGSFPNNATVDLYYATRSSGTGSFGRAVQIPAVNTPSSEIGPVLSHDGCELYFASDRGNGVNYHLFHATVAK